MEGESNLLCIDQHSILYLAGGLADEAKLAKEDRSTTILENTVMQDYKGHPQYDQDG
jgi:hypothetical protein